jgi:protein-S-isoprenylcysteine O-methyltransferase Ste14
MGIIHFLFRPERQIHFPLNTTGILFIIVGLTMIIWVGQLFKKIKTEIHTFKDPGRLVTEGLFQYSRNPIYLGFELLLTGFSILSGTYISFVFPVAFFLVANFGISQSKKKT